MTNWIYKVNIKQYLNQYDGDGGEVPILTVAENVAKELKTLPYWIFGDYPDALISETKKAIERVPEDTDYHELAFNRTLSMIYDRADEGKVWLGL